jgi:O-antigen ligase
MFAYGIVRVRTILLAGFIVIGAVLWVPDAIWSRVAFSTEVDEGGRMEARARLYTAAIEHFDEYVITGVGAGNFWESWGVSNGFSRQYSTSMRVLGSHNIFVQVTIYWGLVGLASLVVIIWQAYRHFPKHSHNNPLALCLLGISVSLLVWMLQVHNLYDKAFSLGLGIIVGARTWIWRRGVVR